MSIADYMNCYSIRLGSYMMSLMPAATIIFITVKQSVRRDLSESLRKTSECGITAKILLRIFQFRHNNRRNLR